MIMSPAPKSRSGGPLFWRQSPRNRPPQWRHSRHVHRPALRPSGRGPRCIHLRRRQGLVNRLRSELRQDRLQAQQPRRERIGIVVDRVLQMLDKNLRLVIRKIERHNPHDMVLRSAAANPAVDELARQ